MPSIVLSVGNNVPFAPSDRVLAPYDGSSSQHLSLSRFAPKFSAFALPAKRGEFWLKNGEENRKNSRFFGASPPVFPIATPPLLSRPVSFRPVPPTDGIDVVAKLCSPLHIKQLPGRFALDTRRTRIIRGHIDRLLGEGKQKRPRSTKIDRGRELECADIAAGTAARRLSVCLCVCRKVR